MLSTREAHDLVRAHLGDSARARHSIFVGSAMRRLAAHLGEDAVLWEVVGLCHDIDYYVTEAEPATHGLVAAAWLKEVLPPEALRAIQAHDHRTGVTSGSVVGDCLKLADALAIVARDLGGRAVRLLISPDPRRGLLRALPDRPYLTTMVLEGAKRLGVPLTTLVEICSLAPPPG